MLAFEPVRTTRKKSAGCAAARRHWYRRTVRVWEGRLGAHGPKLEGQEGEKPSPTTAAAGGGPSLGFTRRMLMPVFRVQTTQDWELATTEKKVNS